MRVEFIRSGSTHRRAFAAGDVAVLDGDELIAVLLTGAARIVGASPLWTDLMFPAQAVNPAGLAAAPSWDETHCGWSFVHTVDNVIQVVAQMPHGWAEQTEIRPHLHLKTVGTSTDKTVTWEVKYRVALPNSGAYGDWVTSTVNWDVPASADASRICSLGAIDMAGYTLSTMIDFQITRKTGGGTDLGAAIVWKQFDIHYLVDSYGSGAEYIK